MGCKRHKINRMETLGENLILMASSLVKLFALHPQKCHLRHELLDFFPSSPNCVIKIKKMLANEQGGGGKDRVTRG